MNAKCYRTVFNAVRGMLVAVEESARSTGKGRQTGGQAGSPVAASVTTRFAVLPLVFGAWCTLGLSYTVHAQVVAAPGSGAQVIQTQNGLQQVNVARPNGSGVSLNTYTQFNVPGQGTILNNAPGITQTQQAGYINGNPNLLPGGSARIIVNQVTSTSPSTLQGYLEVAGPRAEVVIANPNGILVNGGGFINTSRATLTTGVPVFGGSGSLDAYRVTGGQITVQGAGLNATNVDQVDLIARAVSVNASVYANQLNVVAGANQVDRGTLNATPIAGDGAAPANGIDVSQLGGMYANKILLASTEKGVGVSLRGVAAAQAGDLTLTAQGQLVLAGQTSATGNLNIAGRDGITNTGATYGTGTVSVSTGGALNNGGTLASQQGLTVNAGALASAGSLGAGVASDGTISQAADLNVTTTGALSATGKNVAGGNASFQGAGVSLANSQTTANANLALTSTGSADLTGATVHAGGAVNATAAGAFINDRGHLSSGGATGITAGSVSNAGGQIVSQGATSLRATGALNNAQGTMQAGGALTVNAASVDNTAGRLVSLNTDGLSVNASTAITNAGGTTSDGAQGGVIGANGAVSLTTGTLTNHAQITAGTDATLTATTLDNANGSVTAGNALTAQVAGAMNNQHGALSAASTTVNAASLDNTAGKLEGNQLGITTTGDLVNRGGAINQYSQTDTHLKVGGTLDNTNGAIAANAQNLTIDAQALTNDGGKLLHSGAGILAVVSQGALSNVAGQIQTNGALSTQSGTLDNTNGLIAAQGTETVATTDALNNTNGTLHAGDTLKVQAGAALTNVGGNIESNSAHGALAVSAASLDNTSGRVVNVGDGTTRVAVQQTLLNANPAGTTGRGLIGGNGAIDLTAGTLENHATISAKGDASLTAQRFDNSNGNTTAGGALTASVAGALVNRQGVLSGNATSLTAASLDNSSGRIEGNQLDIAATGDLVNRGGTIQQFGQADASITAGGTLDNTAGSIAVNGKNLTLAGQTIANDGGKVQHAGTGMLSVSAQGAFSNTSHGQMQTNGLLAAQAGSVDNTLGSVSALGSSAMTTSGDLVNKQGTLYGQAGLSLTSGGRIDNTQGSAQTGGNLAATAAGALANVSGVLSANGAHGTATVSAASLDNTSGRLVNAGDGLTSITAANTLTNAGGALGGNGDVTVNTPALTNTGGGQIAAGGALTLNTSTGINNRGGALYGARGLTLTQSGAALANDGGVVLGGQDVNLHVASLTNTGGAIRANRDIAAQGAVSGSGEMTAGGNLSLNITGDYLNDAANRLRADGNMQVTVSGTLTNTGTLGAAGNTTVQAANVVNTASGDITGTATTVSAANGINNAGRIEGDAVQTNSAGLFNTGTVIGNTVLVQANDVTNAGASALIAGVKDTKVYATNSVSNLDGATIYSAGNLQIARDGTRDAATGLLANQVGTLTNRSATIDADGDIDIAAHTLTNTRTSIVTAAGTPQTATQTLSAWFAGFTGNDRRFHSSLTFPSWSWSGENAPVSANLMGALMQPITVTVPKSTVANLNTATKTLSFTQAPIESYENPDFSGGCGSGDTGTDCTPQYTLTRNLTSNATQYYQSIQDNGATYSITFWPDWDPNKNIRPDQVRLRFDLGSDSHDYSEISRTVTTTTTTDQLISASDPGKIRASGAIRINGSGGTILNQSSIMAAGGDLIRWAAGGTVTDQGTALQQSVATTETSTFYWHQKRGGDSDTQVVPYPTSPVASTTVMALPAIASSNQTVQTTAQSISVNTVNRLGQTVTGSGVTGGGASASAVGSAGDGTQSTAALSGSAGSTVGAASGNTGNGHAPQTLGSAQTGIPNLTLPLNGLFHFQPAPSATYLVATDARFTQYTKFISSDYMLGALGLNPQQTQKRLGDGFYEEKLVRDQITQLTGRTFLAGYTDQLSEYRALMDAGVTYARIFNLTPGIGLSDAQMQQLTSNMVWLVSQDVTLPDGTHQSVLVPKLYLAQASTVDLNSTGALVTGKAVNLNASGDLANSGRIVGDMATQVVGNTIVNRGAIGGAGGATLVQAVQDVRNIGGSITGQNVVVQAGRDVINETQTISNLQTIGPNGYSAGATGVGSVGSITATNNVSVLAGRDITLAGATVSAGNNAQLAAGRDLNLGTITLGTTQDAVSRGGQSYFHDQTTTVSGSTVSAGGNVVAVAGRDATLTSSAIQAGGDATVVAGRNVTVTAASDTHTHSEGSLGADAQYKKSSYDETVQGSAIQAGNSATLGAGQTQGVGRVLQASDITPATPEAGGTGNLAVLGSAITTEKGVAKLAATGDVTIGAVSEQHNSDHWSEDKHSGVLSSSSSRSVDTTARTDAVGSTLSADSVSVSAGRDINVKGSSIAATNDATLNAQRDINIESATASSSETHFREETRSGLMGSGGVGFMVGSRKQSEDDRNTQTTAVASTVGSTNGNVSLTAGNHYQQTGSNVIAVQGDIDIQAKKVDIIEARETSHNRQETKFEQSGLTVAVTAPVIAALQTASQMGSAASQTSDARLKLLAGGATALAGKNAADAIAADPKSGGGASISITVGGSKSQSLQTQDTDSAAGSAVKAGGNVRIHATGDGQNSTLTVQGSNIQAGKDALLKADGDVNLQAAKSSSDMERSSSSMSGGVGVAVSVSSNGASFGVTANASASRGTGNGHDVTWTNTHVNAGNQLTIESGGDTNIKGAVASGKQVVANVGGDLNVASLQDTSTFHSKDQSIAGSVTVGVGFSGSASVSQQKIDSDYASVTEQSGIKAGDGGFQVNVHGNTDLKGAVIASTDKAVQNGANSLTTGTLTTSEIHNHADYSASSIGIGGGYSSGGSGVGTNQKGEATSGGDKVPGTTLPSAGGFSAAPPIVMGASGSGSSTTVSGISGGAIHITDGAKQQALTGKDADQTVASVNRNVSTEVDTSGALKPIFNEKEIKVGFEITGAFISQAGTFLNNRARESTEAQKALDTEKAKPADQQDGAKIAQLTQTLQDNATWGIGGTGRMLLTALTAGAGGNVTGGMGQLAQNAAVAYLQELGANQVKQIADSIGSEDARAALHAIVGCAGAAASSQSCGAGAMGAAASSVLGSLLGPTDGMTPDQKQARVNLVTSVVAGLAASTGVNAATATSAGQIEVENNQVWAPRPSPPPPSPGQPQKPFEIPGFKGDTAKKGDGVISDPMQQVDPTANVHANPVSEQTGPKILVSPIDIIKTAIENVIAMASGWKRGDDVYQPTSNNNDPSWSAVRSRFWKNEAQATDAADKYGQENLDRMRKGLAPQRYNADKGGMESMELSHEPTPARDGGKEFVPRWPQDHATVDPYRRPGY
ncbi:hemagglutinin-related protein [Ralstonia solanacearum Po82]|uniref:Hemagglutinin-related protein n=7 Tax=Ralstonia solanacearum TaxID=305 RepID=F6G6P4_RALS8|nr:hemagglutinin repeat-containing protein [Ralstonia solanacearum]AEG67589.1 hemagglutinin-related protein [Ralstonia solanacearum Po82]